MGSGTVPGVAADTSTLRPRGNQTRRKEVCSRPWPTDAHPPLPTAVSGDREISFNNMMARGDRPFADPAARTHATREYGVS